MSLIPHTTPKSHRMIDGAITGSDVNWILVMYTILWCFVVCDWTSRMYFLYCKVTNLTSKIHWHGTIWKNYTILMRLISDLLDSRLISCLIVTFRSLYSAQERGILNTSNTWGSDTCRSVRQQLVWVPLVCLLAGKARKLFLSFK